MNDATKLLAIDDNRDNLTTLSAVVRNALPQAVVLTAQNGLAGIELAAAEDPDVILLDIVMPGMDGFEVCRRLKADERMKDIPVVFLTAIKTDAASRVIALEVGADGFLAKPLEPVELTAQIRAMTKVKAANRFHRTENKRLEALVAERTRELQESERRYRDLLESISDGIFVLDRQWRYILINEVAAGFVQKSKEELLGNKLTDLFPGIEETPFFRTYRRVMETRESGVVSGEFSFVGGRKGWYEVRVDAVPDGILCLSRDITERKQAEDVLRKSEERYRDVIGAHAGVVWEMDEHFRITHLVGRVRDIFGYEPEEIIGQNPIFLVDPKDRQRVSAIMARLTEEHKTINNIGYWCRHKDGSRVRLLTSGVSFFDQNGGFLGSRGTNLDVTEVYWARSCQEIIFRLHEMSCDSDEAISALLCEACAKLTDSPMSFFGMLEPDELAMTAHVWSPQAMAECRISDKPMRFPIETAGLWAEPIRRREPIIYNDYAHASIKQGLPDGHVPINRYMGIPITEGNKVIAVAGVANRGAIYEERHITRLRLITSTISDYLSNRRKGISLRESEEKYRILFNTFPLGITVSDHTGKIVESNAAAEKWLGIPKDEHKKRHIDGPQWRIIRPDGTPMPPDEYASARALKENRLVEDVEMGIVKPDGNITWINVSATPLNLEGYGVVVTYGDITERKRSEAAVRESEANFRAFFESMQDMILVGTLEGRVLHANDAIINKLGYSLEEIDERGILGLHPSDRRHEAEEILAAMSRGERNSCPLPLQRKDGKLVPVETRTFFGKWTGMDCLFGISKDLSSEQEAQQRFEGLFRNNPAPMALSSLPSRRLVDVNEAFLKTLGYSRPEVIGKTSYELGLFVDADQQKAMADRLADEGRIANFELKVRAMDGSLRDGLFSGEVVKSQDGEYFLTVMIDITERKRAEEERDKLKSELRQAQKMESIGTLAGGIAHDFNNILSPIMLHAEMALMDLPANSPVRKSLSQIYASGERARDLVKQILTFARKTEENRFKLKTSLIVKEALKFLRATIPTAIDVRYNFSTEEDTVYADPTQINQIIMNLCTNAAHAMEEKGGILEIVLENQDIDPETREQALDLDSGRYLKLTVKDTGHGIEADILDKIFDPYFTTKEVGKGTGMGLAIAHGIVRSYGGAITVQSEVGKGSSFYVYLPLIKSSDDGPGTQPDSWQILRGSERILFVDDELSIVNAAENFLQRLGYQVTPSTSSIEALEAFRKNPGRFDLVITDMTMPNMTGIQLVTELMGIRPDVPVILCTGFSAQIDENRAKGMGIRAFVMKPIVMSHMAHTIRKVLDDKISLKDAKPIIERTSSSRT